jgi:hypothetical protein
MLEMLEIAGNAGNDAYARNAETTWNTGSARKDENARHAENAGYAGGNGNAGGPG